MSTRKHREQFQDCCLFFSVDPSSGPGGMAIASLFVYREYGQAPRVVMLNGCTSGWQRVSEMKNFVTENMDAVFKKFPFLRENKKKIRFIIAAEGNMNCCAQVIIEAAQNYGMNHRLNIEDPFSNEKFTGIRTVGADKLTMLLNLANMIKHRGFVFNSVMAQAPNYIPADAYRKKFINQFYLFMTIKKISTSGKESFQYSGKTPDGKGRDDTVASMWIGTRAINMVHLGLA